ncbi:MAG: radical SAM protein [Pseudomonadota bacterium]|nr:radical SAM protein [Pseudomonadota bacterium]
MARVLLAHNYHLPLDPREAKAGKPYPPLGTLVSAAMAEAAGHDLAVYDPMFTPRVETFADALDGHRPARVAILADPHAVAQKMCLTSMREAAFTMIRYAKARGIGVLVAGPDTSDQPAMYRAAGADVVVVGEHDGPLLEWLDGVPHGGILPRRPVLADLSRLPFPAWDRVDMPAYAERWRAKHGAWEMNVSTARGCPYRCNWCAKPTWGRTYHVRPPEHVAAEVRALVSRYGVDRVWFTDDIFAIKPVWLRKYRECIGDTPVPYRCLTRVDLLQDEAYVADLAASGCREVWVGVESGAQHVLDAMDKDCTVAEMRRASGLLRDHGIRRGFFLQLGYPGETYQDVLATARLIRELGPEEIGVTVSYPLPGTPFHDRVKDRLRATNWAAAMDNEVLFESDYPQAFYDAARELIRSEHALIRFQPDLSRQGARRAAGAMYHLCRWPMHRGKLAWQARRARPA